MTPMHHDSVNDSPGGVSADRIAAYHVSANDSEEEEPHSAEHTPHSAAETVPLVRHACTRVSRGAATWQERAQEDGGGSSFCSGRVSSVRQNEGSYNPGAGAPLTSPVYF